MTAKQAQKNAGKYKSISAAKKAGSLYYKDKNGKVQIAAYAEDLKKIPKVKMDDPNSLKGVIISKRPVLRGQSQTKKNTNLADTPGKEDTILRSKTTPKRSKTQRVRPADTDLPKSAVPDKKPINKDDIKEELGANKGGMMMKKKKAGYAAGGMPMVMKGGVKVPAFAADGKGKMNMGGMAAKKKPAAKKMMAGGMATKKKPAAKKMMAGGMTKKSGYMYGGMAKKKMKK